MQIAVTEAKALLLDLIRRAESGEEIVLTRHGTPVARITTIPPTAKQRMAAIAEAQAMARHAKPEPGQATASNHDFLYDDDGLPG